MRALRAVDPVSAEISAVLLAHSVLGSRGWQLDDVGPEALQGVLGRYSHPDGRRALLRRVEGELRVFVVENIKTEKTQ